MMQKNKLGCISVNCDAMMQEKETGLHENELMTRENKPGCKRVNREAKE